MPAAQVEQSLENCPPLYTDLVMYLTSKPSQSLKAQTISLSPQELVANNSGIPVMSYEPWASPKDRLEHELKLFQKEYFAMLYGGVVSKAKPRSLFLWHPASHNCSGVMPLSIALASCLSRLLPDLVRQVVNNSDPHFALATTGVAITDGAGRQVLYAGGDACMCVDEVSLGG